MFSQFSTHPHMPRVCGKLPKVIIIYDVVELDLIGSDDVDGHNHLVNSD